MFITACETCKQFPVPLHDPIEEQQPDGGVVVFATPVVCACDPRWAEAKRRSESWRA